MPASDYKYLTIPLDEKLVSFPIDATGFRFMRCVGIDDQSVSPVIAFGSPGADQAPLAFNTKQREYDPEKDLGTLYISTGAASGVPGASIELWISRTSDLEQEPNHSLDTIKTEKITTRMSVGATYALLPATPLQGRHTVRIRNLTTAESGEATQSEIEIIDAITDSFGDGEPLAPGGTLEFNIAQGVPLIAIGTATAAFVSVMEGR